jgi:uncharacterized protein YuzE
MKLSYDPRYNVAYLKLLDKTVEVETVRISDQLNVDIAPDGKIFGIELLNANEQLLGSDGGVLEVINEAIGDRKEITLSR